ncbi:MAG TPA: phosphotransferase [Solirubrobacteraceae bacterium]|nr:phosphotransferase [Solirubrobacteraceae bacterium]
MSASVSVPALAPDPGVPGRDVLLDDAAMAERLARLMSFDGPLPIDRYGRGRVKYRVGDSLRVVHELQIGGAPWLVASRTFAGRSRDVYESALRGAAEAGPLRVVAHDPELEAVFWTFPNDRKIGSLRALAPSTETASRLLGRPVARTVLAAYAPEKSATAACLDGSGTPIAYAKVFASAEEAAASRRAHEALYGEIGSIHSAVRVPAVLAWSPDERMLVVEAMRGRRIDTLFGPDLVHAMRRFGAALACLHSVPVPGGLPAFGRLDPARQRAAADTIGRTRPDVAAAAERLAGDLAAEAPRGEAPVCLHGDVHLKNGLIDGRRVALIDLDQAGLGQAAADLASVLASLRYRALVTDERARGEKLRAALLDGYGSLRELPDPATLRWHVAAALLTERALRAVSRVRPGGLMHLGAVLNDARAVLRGEASR